MMNIEDLMDPQEAYEDSLSDLERHAKACPAAALAVDLIYAMGKTLHNSKLLGETVNACVLFELIEPVNEVIHFAVDLREQMEAVANGGPERMIVR